MLCGHGKNKNPSGQGQHQGSHLSNTSIGWSSDRVSPVFKSRPPPRNVLITSVINGMVVRPCVSSVNSWCHTEYGIYFNRGQSHVAITIKTLFPPLPPCVETVYTTFERASTVRRSSASRMIVCLDPSGSRVCTDTLTHDPGDTKLFISYFRIQEVDSPLLSTLLFAPWL
jgi:hypothetical protein